MRSIEIYIVINRLDSVFCIIFSTTLPVAMESLFLLKNKHLLKDVKSFKERLKDQNTETPVIQQSDYLREFMLKIVNEGLAAAYDRYGKNPPGPPHPTQSAFTNKSLPDVQSDVIIVGAGVAGLAAAYELQKAGLTVKILEQTHRCGGRVFSYPLGPGLYGEGKQIYLS